MTNQQVSKNLESTKSKSKTCTLKVWDGKDWHEIEVKRGANLRATLQKNDLSPHDSITSRINCHGKGVCALCSVRIDSSEPKPKQWLDSLTAKFGWRVSCQVAVEQDLTVLLD